MPILSANEWKSIFFVCVWEEDPTYLERNFLSKVSIEVAENIRMQLSNIITKFGLKTNKTNTHIPLFTKYLTEYNVKRAILEGFFTQIAYRSSRFYYKSVKFDQVSAAYLSFSLFLRSKINFYCYNTMYILNVHIEFCFATQQFCLQIYI